MIRAEIKTEPHGYVVWATITDNNDNREHYPLRNFGTYQSAAIEFRTYINNPKVVDYERLVRNVKLWAKSYNPEVLYTYPTILKNGNIALIKQSKQ